MSGLHRPKRPEQVQQAILHAASGIAVRHGIQTVTLQAVADAAGVTKGGLMHHFRDKSALIDAMREHAITTFSAMLDDHLASEVGMGRFTRAYVRTCLDVTADDVELQLTAAMWADPQLRADWYAWMADQEARHAATDAGTRFKVIRLAADGAWLAALDGCDTADWQAELLGMA